MRIKNSEVFTADLHKVVDGKETVVSQWRFYIRIEPYFIPLHTIPNNGWYKYFKKHISDVKRIPNTYFVPGVPSESGLILTNVQHFDFGRTKRKTTSISGLNTWEKVNAVVNAVNHAEARLQEMGESAYEIYTIEEPHIPEETLPSHNDIKLDR